MADKTTTSQAGAAPTADSPAAIRNVVLVGPSGGGKTTLVEALLVASGVLTRQGSVVDGTTVCDSDEAELAQQRSVGLALAPLEHDGIKVNLIDTPGYADFVGELRAGLRAADCALFVIAANEGVDDPTKSLWLECAQVGMPRAVVITKLDHARANYESALVAAQAAFGDKVLPLYLAADSPCTGLIGLLSQTHYEYSNGKRTDTHAPDASYSEPIEVLRGTLIEGIIEESEDETLMERYLGGEEIDQAVLIEDLEKAVARGSFFPVIPACSGTGVGTLELLEIMTSAFPSPPEHKLPEVFTPQGKTREGLACDPNAGLPKLDVGVEANDNVYASNTAKKPDTIFTINPEFDLASRWSRNALQAYARAASRQYAKYDTESTTDWQVGGAGRFDISHGSLTAGGDTGDFSEPRTSPTTSFVSTKPIRYTASNAFVGAMEELNRVRLSARYDYSNFDYQNGTNSSGGSVLENDRDHYVSTITGKAEYALSPATAVFVDAAYNEHHYSLNPPAVPTNKNSKGDEVNVGANFDLSHVARGEVEVGYLKQDFVGKLGSVSGLSAKAQVEWFPTQLTTVTLTGSRSIQDAAATGSPAYVAGAVGLQADHELLRNLILTGRAGLENDDYQGVDRKDRTTNASVGAKYLINRMVGVTLSYQYINLDSSGLAKGPKYTVNRITASTNLQF